MSTSTRSSPVSGGLSRRRFLGTALATGATAATIPGFSIAQSARRDLRVGIFGGDFGNLSPVQRWDISSGLVMNHLFDNLVRVDYAGRRIVPWLAEEWSNPDPLTWRIRLKEGVKWHGGFGDFTAEDVAYTWNHHLETQSFQVGTALFPIDTVKTDGKYVVEVKTRTPFGAFPGVTMGYGGMTVSRNAHQEMGDAEYSLNPIGQGPYALESLRSNEVELVRNEAYWRLGFPKLDRISYRAVPDSTVRLQALQNGELDFITHPDPRAVAGMREDSGFTVTSTPGWNWDYQMFNLRGAQPTDAYTNKLVRQAISYAIDREAIVNEIYSGEATPTDNQIPPGYLGHEASLLHYPKNGDLAKARELMAQAGVSGYEVEVITSDKDWLRRELELVAAMVSQIGITYRIQNMDIGSFNNRWLNHNYQQTLEDITLVAPDPDSACWWFLNSKGSLSSWDNPQMDQLLDGARAEADQAARAGMYGQIGRMTAEECPQIFHCNVNFVRIFNADLQGFAPAPQEYIEMLDEVSWS
ncbi:ABC transporter substrate-binding protein [Arenibacterium sp. LLYu02]|uniref:ABC transporter substrate-binding protein n=1 Tax=Arenibacterium sp. LLYu02 TaxID=3404132 RepID=UPI003B22665B